MLDGPAIAEMQLLSERYVQSMADSGWMPRIEANSKGDKSRVAQSAIPVAVCCEICGSEDDLALCWIDGERAVRCDIHVQGIVPATEDAYWRSVSPKVRESEAEAKLD